MAVPTPEQVYANASAGLFDARTPGLNEVISAWRALQDFTGNWAVANYNQALNVSNLNSAEIT